jgi:hypothetical protein
MEKVFTAAFGLMMVAMTLWGFYNLLHLILQTAGRLCVH